MSFLSFLNVSRISSIHWKRAVSKYRIKVACDILPGQMYIIPYLSRDTPGSI